MEIKHHKVMYDIINHANNNPTHKLGQSQYSGANPPPVLYPFPMSCLLKQVHQNNGSKPNKNSTQG